jgi:hypothetical protein
MTVAKLRGARDRKRKALGKCEGRKSLAEMHPAVVREAKRLGRASPKSGERRSLRKIRGRARKDRGGARCYWSAKCQGGGSGVFRTQWSALQRQERPGHAGPAPARRATIGERVTAISALSGFPRRPTSALRRSRPQTERLL